ncbi:MAG TPA: MASE3 domain-containing protein, partial [Burkholderiales bacterium]|nr:MASE3 domain-containing protein [Burkholderiales bacterium]
MDAATNAVRSAFMPAMAGAFSIAALVALYFSNLYSYLLFHSLVEVIRVAVAFGVFMLAWHSRTWSGNDYLKLLGIAYLWVGVMTLAHLLAYKGMGVFPGFDANLPTQLWTASRYMEAVSFCVAPLFVRMPLRIPLAFALYFACTFALVASIFGGYFPDCYSEGTGLTPFKIWSEYVISLFFIGSFITLFHYRSAFDSRVFAFLAASIPAAVAAELMFTRYAHPFAAANEAGHFLALLSTWLVYRAILVTGLVRPFGLLLHAARQKSNELEAKVAERTARLRESEERFRSLFDSSADAVFIVDDVLKILEVNEIACRRLGYRRSDLIGRTLQ